MHVVQKQLFVTDVFSKTSSQEKKFLEKLQMAFGQIIQGYVHP